MGYVQTETRRGWGLGGSPEGDRRGLSLADARHGPVRLIRFRGHLPKGGYDVPNGQRDEKPATAPAV